MYADVYFAQTAQYPQGVQCRVRHGDASSLPKLKPGEAWKQYQSNVYLNPSDPQRARVIKEIETKGYSAGTSSDKFIEGGNSH